MYDDAILNIGILTFNNIPDHYCWLEIKNNNKWYSFNPCTDQIIEKEIFDDLLGYNLYDLFPEIKDHL